MFTYQNMEGEKGFCVVKKGERSWIFDMIVE